MWTYRFCDRIVSSDRPLSLPDGHTHSVDYDVTMLRLRDGSCESTRALTERTSDGGPVRVLHSKVPNEYVIRFTRLADFVIRSKRQIRCLSLPGIAYHTLEHLLLDHVLPRVLGHEGRTVLHSAAVRVEERAVAFLGETGWGKSTLTASLWRTGGALISDDCVVITDVSDSVMVLGSYPTLRLWQDSMRALDVGGDTSAPITHFSNKQRIRVDAGPNVVSDYAIPLQQLYLLAPPSDAAGHVSISDIPPHERVIHLLEHSFRLDLTDRERNAAEFDRLTILAERLPMYRLQYPRRYETLPDVREALLAHMASTT